MATQFRHEVLKKCVALICQSIGFQGVFTIPMEVLTDLLHRYLKEVAVVTKNFAEHDNRTSPTLTDLERAFQQLNVSLPELEEYVNSVDSLPFPDVLPAFPLKRPSELNLLKPGSKEILSRPIHIHEHLPPMLPEEEDSKDGNAGSPAEDEFGGLQNNGDMGSPPGNSDGYCNTSDPFSSSTLRSSINEGEPVREIDSVMMTASGYISSAREGKLPDARLPHIPLPQIPEQTQPKAAPVVSRSNQIVAPNPSPSASAEAAAAAAALRKKKSLERLLRHKNKVAQQKAAAAAAAAAANGNTNAGNSLANNSNKKILSHKAVLNAAAASMSTNNQDPSMCFTTKHGKSKDKMKPKIPPTPPGTCNALASMYNRDQSLQASHKTGNLPGLPGHGGPIKASSYLPPKLKIPTPKVNNKVPEYSTDVLPLPKEHIQEQEENKLQILKKEEKQKELARAAASGQLKTLPERELKNNKKDKDKKEFKKLNKDIRKEKSDKMKKDLKRVKLRKEDKEKTKKKKEDKKKEKHIKKQKHLKKGDELLLSPSKEIKMKDKNLSKKEKKDKKLKKVGRPRLLSPNKEDFMIGDSMNMSETAPNETSVEQSLNIPELDKSKLCIFKKGSGKISVKDTSALMDDDTKIIDDNSELSLPDTTHNNISNSPTTYNAEKTVKSSKKRSKNNTSLSNDSMLDSDLPPSKKFKYGSENDILNPAQEFASIADDRPPTPGKFPSMSDDITGIARPPLNSVPPPPNFLHAMSNPNFFPPFISTPDFGAGIDVSNRPPTPGRGAAVVNSHLASQFFKQSFPPPPPQDPGSSLPGLTSTELNQSVDDFQHSVVESEKKKKDKEHKKDKKDKAKDKDKIKKKKDKKEKIKIDKKESKDKPKKDKSKEKELKKVKKTVEHSVEVSHQVAPKIVIKRTDSSAIATTTLSAESQPLTSQTDFDAPGSPEIARISALIHRPPKDAASSSSSLTNFNSPNHFHNQPQVLPPLKIKEVVPHSSSSGTKHSVSSVVPPLHDALSGSSKKSSSSKKPLVTTHYVDERGVEVWLCPTCLGPDVGTPMIGCDGCDDWYHWKCQGIQVPPSESDNWYCPKCISNNKQCHPSKKSKKSKRK